MTDKLFMDVNNVAEVLEVSNTKAYEIIRTLNKELREQGYIVVQGKVNTKYFMKKYMYQDQEVWRLAVYKDKERGTWYVSYRFTDAFGEHQRKVKRGFRTRAEENQWEREDRMKEEFSTKMKLFKIYELYEKDVS